MEIKSTNRCCSVCDQKKVCHICGEQTLFACSDCQINFSATVYVCYKSECRDAHERKCFGARALAAPDAEAPEFHYPLDAAPDMEKVVEMCAEKVHDAYLETALRLGWIVKPELNMPYDQLNDEAKELDRATARAALAAMGVGR